MANLKDIKEQIKSVKNTEKTTKAMKLVSNVKLKKAKDVALQSSAYALKINEVLSEISAKIASFSDGKNESIFFDCTREVKVVDLIFITSDKGLCGGFNIQSIKTIKSIINEYKEKKIKVRLRAVGKKGIEYFNFQGVEILEKYVGVSSNPSYEKAQKIINLAIEDFRNGKTDKVILIHNGYKNMISQEIRINDIVPIEPPMAKTELIGDSAIEFEPNDGAMDLMEKLMVKYFEYGMYYALVDSLAAEHSARMNAMENATNNAKERVRSLNLAYNKARQSSITTELIEIISGVEAMK
jgi:ATP synthase F1, gamma subunit